MISRSYMKLVVVGEVDHGKSTLLGRLLVDGEMISEEQAEELRQQCRLAQRPFEYAFLLDRFDEEREERMTVDTTQVVYHGRHRDYIFIDSPGHKEFLKNMITGACQASAALLVVDVTEGVQIQTYRHAYILSMLGIRNVIVVLNKMDRIHYDQKQYLQVFNEMALCLEKMEFRAVTFIPVSASLGGNLVKRSHQMSWYSGPTVMEAVSRLPCPPTHESLPLRIPIQDMYSNHGQTIVVGRIASGIVHEGMEVNLHPPRRKDKIESLMKFGQALQTAQAGDSIGIRFCGNGQELSRGQMISCVHKTPTTANLVVGRIFWMSKQDLQLRQKMTIRLGTQETTCIVERITNRINSGNLEVLERESQSLHETEVAKVALLCTDPVVFDHGPIMPVTGRFVLLNGDKIVAGGIIP